MEDFSGCWRALRDFELRIIIPCADRGFPEAAGPACTNTAHLTPVKATCGDADLRLDSLVAMIMGSKSLTAAVPGR
jgi:hypothetical protein